MPEMTEELPEKDVKRIEESAILLKKIAQLEAHLEEMKKEKEAEMSRLAANMVQIEANLRIAKLEADLVDERERIGELERKIAETKRKNDDLEAQLRTQIMEVREGKAKIGELDGKINALRSKNFDLETQIDRTMTFLDRDGWSYLAKTASWYKVIDQYMTFDEAVAYCASRRIDLVSIHSQEENDFVQELGSATWSDGFWIGLKRNPDKGNAFEWTDGSSVDFTNWDERELGSETHAEFWSCHGKWGTTQPTIQEEALVEGFLAKPAEEIALRLDFNDNLIAVTQLLRHHNVPSAVARHFKRALAIRRREQSPVTHTAESPKDIAPSSQEEAPEEHHVPAPIPNGVIFTTQEESSGEYRVSTPIPTVDSDVIFNPESKSQPQSTEEAVPGTSTTVDVSRQTSPRRKRKPRNRGAKRRAAQAIAAAARTIRFDSSRLTITFNNRQ
ncbi:unnamed protein product, partial [Mesorhabditis belari]|uniref:C-type lectin domain-containing protein n=1 Tax=Mesorhabditis belari TaxID=2138241 RepID=A0AAF3F971_9BILA